METQAIGPALQLRMIPFEEMTLTTASPMLVEGLLRPRYLDGQLPFAGCRHGADCALIDKRP